MKKQPSLVDLVRQTPSKREREDVDLVIGTLTTGSIAEGKAVREWLDAEVRKRAKGES